MAVTDAEHMANIMCFIAGNIARELGRPILTMCSQNHRVRR